MSNDMAGNRVQLRLDGALDVAEASRVHEALGSVAGRTQVTLDFRFVSRIEDVALALLVQDFASLDGRLKILGLGQHQRRMLGYLGVPEFAADRLVDAVRDLELGLESQPRVKPAGPPPS